MQWGFLILALLAALAELHTGTFYLAAVALAALISAVLGFFVPDPALILVFLVVSVALIVILALTPLRRRLAGHDPTDLDAGQSVTILEGALGDGSLSVRYRGTRWAAVMAEGTAPPAGATALIVRRTDKLLYLAALPPRPKDQDRGNDKHE